MIAGGSLASRGLVVLILLAFAGLIWVAILSPALSWRENTQTELDQSHADILRLHNSIMQLELERDRLSTDNATDILWSAVRQGEATAIVQSSLNTLARKSGVTVRSITPIQTRDLPFASAVGFRLESEATLDQLTSLLVDLEYNMPPLIVERANIRRLTRPGRTAPQPLIFIQLEVLAPVIITGEAG